MPEPFRLVLGAEDLAGAVEPLEGRVLIRVDLGHDLQDKFIFVTGERHPLLIAYERPLCFDIIHLDAEQFQPLSLKIETIRTAVEPLHLHTVDDQGMVVKDLKRQIGVCDVVAGRRVIFQEDGFDLTHRLSIVTSRIPHSDRAA